ncbi:MAG: CIA30 family protein, partial [Flavobacteriales bacterium]
MLSSIITSPIIFDFNLKSDLKKWTIVDDVVMGGRSSGNFRLNDDGHGVFEGEISLENNGGFSSVRYDCEKILLEGKTQVNMKLL